MPPTQIRGMQIRPSSLDRDRIDPAFEASLVVTEAAVEAIVNPPTTDTTDPLAYYILSKA